MSSLYKSVKVFDYEIFISPVEDIDLHKKTLISTINQYSYVMAEQDSDFKNALKQSDILLPDGIAIVLAAKILTDNKIKKIAGADVHHALLEKLNHEGGSCFFLGASETTLSKIKARLKQEYQNIRVGTFSPPFKNTFTDAENQQMLDEVNAFAPEVLFIGMTAPKQEKWAYKNKDLVTANIICSIGAVFDFYAGTIKRPSPIVITMGLEWLFRLIKEPKRMWKRYLYFGPAYIFLLMKEKYKCSKMQ
jgi:N-acetylglucosaminyldiphosphoundecaprenol N-acetyl-beta-D-mannosaminyltransferase